MVFWSYVLFALVYLVAARLFVMRAHGHTVLKDNIVLWTGKVCSSMITRKDYLSALRFLVGSSAPDRLH